MNTIVRALLAFACASLGAACGAEATKQQIDEPSKCAIGTEGCPCTTGGACDPHLTCASKLCVNLEGSGGSSGGSPVDGGQPKPPGSGGAGGSPVEGSGGSSQGGAGGGPPGPTPGSYCDAFCTGPETKCNLPSSDKDACMTDCLHRATLVSDKCTTAWAAGMTCGAMQSSWTCSDGAASLSSCVTEQQTYADCEKMYPPAVSGAGGSPSPNTNKCTSDSQCGSKHICSGGSCESVQCTSDSDCGSCSRCSDHSCRDCGYGAEGICTC